MSLYVNIKKHLKNFDLSVEFETGKEPFAILGASGCGKSMTLKCIAGIEKPDEGQIILNDRVLYDSEKGINLPPQKRKVGYMFQDYALFPNMTVEQNIMVGKETKKQAIEYIEKFQLTGLEKHYPHQLSGGQKQRTAMARMLASNPEVVLLDEPFAALDSYMKWEIELEMQELLAEIEKLVVYVSHNRNEVYHLCKTIGAMNKGHMEVIEPVKEFFDNPKTKTAAILSGCKNISAVEKIDETHLFAKDWQVELQVEDIPEGTNYVGIRAHYFERKLNKESNIDYNKEVTATFPIKNYRINEEPFEWNISFQTKEDAAWMLWKIAKRINEEKPVIPDKLTIDKANILFLR